jgi:hypothetical protein
LNERNLLIYDRNSFFTCSLIGDNVVFNQSREFNDKFLSYPKLVGNYLYGFRSLLDANTDVLT